VAIPSFQEITLPLLQFAADDEIHRMIEARAHLAGVFALSEEDQEERLPSGTQGRFANRVAWAKVYLEKAGMLQSPARGQFCITERGREVLKDPPTRLDIPFMERFPDFLEFRSKTRPRPSSLEPSSSEAEATPEEELESAYERLQTELAEELLQNVRRLSPTAFEHLVVDLMIGMGYGGGRPEAGSITQASADGGIDGVINEDRLGLDVIYVQAKRWEHPVGRPEIHKFVGALHGRRTRKGVFIATSRFTPDAQEYVEHIDPRVILIDGERLARLMIDHGVGVSIKDTLRVQQVDLDYFTEE
jgi:restriction system protein